LEEIILLCAGFKAKVVGHDEREAGERAILNYGHTIGHAVEAVSDFKIKHGLAVAIGMVAENKLAFRLGMFSSGEAERIERLVYLAGLPATLPELNETEKEEFIEFIRHDKKVAEEKLRFVLLEAIGRPVVTDKVTPELIAEVLLGRR
jgi:3-dehydroquinate synthase